MRKIIIAVLLFISSTSFSQKHDFQIHSNEIVLGKNLIDSTEIKGLEYHFPERIHETFLDTTTGFLTVQLRSIKKEKWLSNKGHILQFDLNNKKLLWSKKIFYQASNLQQFSQTIIYTNNNKSYCLDIQTGDELWKVKNNIYFVDPVDKIGMGYRFKSTTGYSNELEGIDLNNGNIIWKRYLTREYGWNDVFYINDSTMIVVAAGLHALNIYTGKGWDYNTVTGKKDYTETAVANAAGVAVGILTGAFAISTGHNLVRDIVSNSLVDSSSIYFASKEQLAKIDKNSGEIIWNYPFDNDLPSKSSIFINDSIIYMVNYGYAFMGNRQLDFGQAFIAAFDRQTGDQKFMTLINSKKDPILGFQLLNDEIYLVFKNKIAKHSQNTGKLIAEKQFPEEDIKELVNFIGNQVYITNDDNDFERLTHTDTTKIFVYTSQSKTLVIDDQLNIVDTIDFEDLSIYFLRTNDFKFISKDNKTFIINNNGEKVAEVEASSKAFLLGTTLYDIQNEKFYAIDLKAIPIH